MRRVWIASILGFSLLLAGCGSPRPTAANQSASDAGAAVRPHSGTHTSGDTSGSPARSQGKPVSAATLRFTGLHMFTSKLGWVQSSHQVWRTTDGGVDWTNASPAHLPAPSAINVHFPSAYTAFVTFTVAFRPGWTRVVVDRTTDGGGRWTAASFVVPDSPVGKGSGSASVVADLAFIPPRLGWIAEDLLQGRCGSRATPVRIGPLCARNRFSPWEVSVSSRLALAGFSTPPAVSESLPARPIHT